MSDILERLREAARGGDVFVSPGQAADEIEKLQARIAELETALIKVDRAAYQKGFKAGQESQAARIAELEAALKNSADALRDAGCNFAWAVANAALEGGKS